MGNNIFVIGATGTIGGAITEELNRLGYNITALIHNRSNSFLESNVNLVRVSVEDKVLFKENLKSQDYLVIALSAGNDPEKIKEIERDAAIEILRIAEDVGIKKVVYISEMFAVERFRDHPVEGAKFAVEKFLEESKLNYTIFKPAFIDVTMKEFVRGKKIMILGQQPHPVHVVKLKELAEDAVASLKMAETDGKSYVVTGREDAVLLKIALTEYGKTFDPELPVKIMPMWFMRILNRTFLKGQLTRSIDIMTLMQKYGEIGDLKSYHDAFPR